MVGMAAKESMLARKPNVCRLTVGEVFEKLTLEEKLYAHHMGRAAWNGTRIILQQVSPESSPIFDFIIELYRTCQSNWDSLADRVGITKTEMECFLHYAALFLANIGNYYGHGDQKFIPDMDSVALKRLSSASASASQLYAQFADSIIAETPISLGFPSNLNQSAYYPGDCDVLTSKEDIEMVNKALVKASIHPDNTRILKRLRGDCVYLDVLQAASQREEPVILEQTPSTIIRLCRGDYAQTLKVICENLREARDYVANPLQNVMLHLCIRSFNAGSIDVYKGAQKAWVKDIKPVVESVIGFVEPYRDPSGLRAEFEGLVAIVDKEETKALSRLVEESATFIQLLPWIERENGGTGPFERELFEPPDFTSLQVLAYCSSIIFLGINLPNFNDIRQTVGFKNIVVANRNQALSTSDAPPFISSDDISAYVEHSHIAWKLQITLHELFGHGTGKLLMESSPSKYNFDSETPPTNPLTGEPVKTWYQPGETWNSIFGDIATSVDECRAETVGSFLMAEKEVLAIFGYTDHSDVKADDLIYNLYLQLAVLGLRSLESYDAENQKWGQAHDRGHFAMFRTLLSCPSFLQIHHNTTTQSLQISLDRTQIHTHGRPALASLLLKLHIYRCTADIASCRPFYEELTRVEGKFLEWRGIVLKNRRPRQIFVQANTFLGELEIDGVREVKIVEYEASVRGLIQSWAERGIASGGLGFDGDISTYLDGNSAAE